MFAMPECGIGLFVDIGSAYFLSRLPGEMGMYLALTGQRLKGHPSFNACHVQSMIVPRCCFSNVFQLQSAIMPVCSHKLPISLVLCM